ncbi:site-specific integrase [Streptosporangium lutulentum]|uniref:Site-specific recombinase XerD n=1 Tax=Streptosporangium lutulentum TaxID=1461250 RepID=A0ABT9Q690_9ACTN|nr:tyrosine-type recombinase/integrase [Streptosporangium lutulentum]MDP9842267.1 site-specific recombinase XerD [Streptosporangium lutulentum]
MTEIASREIEVAGRPVLAEIVPAYAPASAVAIHTDADHFLSDAARDAVAAGIPASTMRAYTKDWKAFDAWCVSQGRVSMPATSQTMTEYVTHLTTAISARTGKPLGPASIERALAAIRTWHNAADVNPPQTKGARKVLSGYREYLATTHNPAAQTRKAAPAGRDPLRSMLDKIDRSTLAGKRNAALLLLGYATAARVSELSALNIADVTATEDGLLVNIYRRKIKKYTEVAVTYGGGKADTCPVRTVLALIAAMAEKGRTSGPLFVRVDILGNIDTRQMMRKGVAIGDPEGRITAEAAAEVVTRIANTAGLEGRWTGHSLRRGFATEARKAGAQLEKISRHGGWADGSKAMLGYIEEGDKWRDNPVAHL